MYTLFPLLLTTLGCTFGLTAIPKENDIDGDGVVAGTDCDDNDPDTLGPKESGVDTYNDFDSDGFGGALWGKFCSTKIPAGKITTPGDCDDADASLNPNTWWYPDADNDNYGNETTGYQQCEATDYTHVRTPGDCDDTDADINPETIWYADADGDGYGDPNTIVYTGCEDVPEGAVLDNTDFDDTEALAHPGLEEVCGDGVDNDGVNGADGEDAVDAQTWYEDFDGDGFGNSAVAVIACEAPLGYVADDTDCDDTDALLNPDTIWYQDSDGDGYGNPDITSTVCPQPAGYVADNTDFDDTSNLAFPGAAEVCGDGVNNDGLNGTDDSFAVDALTWFLDFDGDTFGDIFNAVISCLAPAGYVADSTDCDDTVSTTYPGAPEYCNTVDDNCDGTVDEDSAVDAIAYYGDVDGDTFGSASASYACTVPGSAVLDNSDCNDGDAQIYPEAPETCGDGIDSDCGDTDGDLSKDEDANGDECTAELNAQSAVFTADTTTSIDSSFGVITAFCDNDGDGIADPVIAMPYFNNETGAVLMYPSSSTGAVLETDAINRLEGTGIFENFGTGIACGDFTGTGVDGLVVGSFGASAVDVFEGPLNIATASVQTIYGDGVDAFGAAVDISFDGTLVASAPVADGDAPYSGAAYVFAPGSTATDTIDADMTILGDTEGDFVGWDAAIVGDMDGDGNFSDFCIGAPDNDDAGNEAGAVFCFTGGQTGTYSVRDAQYSFTGLGALNYFGISISPAGDTDGDGYDDVVIGAYGNDTNGDESGAAYLVTDPTQSIGRAQTFYGESPGDMFGYSVLGNIDLNSDGNLDIVIGALLANSGAGAAYGFFGNFHSDQIAGSQLSYWGDATVSDYAGGSLSGNGSNSVLVGAPGEADQAGGAFLFTGDGQ